MIVAVGIIDHHAADSWFSEDSAAVALWEQYEDNIEVPLKKHQETKS